MLISNAWTADNVPRVRFIWNKKFNFRRILTISANGLKIQVNKISSSMYILINKSFTPLDISSCYKISLITVTTSFLRKVLGILHFVLYNWSWRWNFWRFIFSIYYFAFTTDTELASNVNNDILFFSWWYIPVKTLSVIPFICHMVRITATATEQAAKTTSWNNFGARTSISFHFWKEGSIFLKQFKLKLLKKMRAGASLLAAK